MAGVTDKAAAAAVQPGALLYSHMGMLATLPNGSLAAAWQVHIPYEDKLGERSLCFSNLVCHSTT